MQLNIKTKFIVLFTYILFNKTVYKCLDTKVENFTNTNFHAIAREVIFCKLIVWNFKYLMETYNALININQSYCLLCRVKPVTYILEIGVSI